MTAAKADMIARLKKEIMPLQGLGQALCSKVADPGLGRMNGSFPGHRFPVGSMHEFLCSEREDAAATGGFIAGILATLMRNGGVAIWIGPSPSIFPPALKMFGIAPEKVIFIDLEKEKEILWATEEALRCEGLAGVVAELRQLSFFASRRLQLAVEKSHVTGFILRPPSRRQEATACVGRWKISALPSVLDNNMPGVGFPRWNVELLKIRNGIPGNWQLEFKAGRFRHIGKLATISTGQQKKTG